MGIEKVIKGMTNVFIIMRLLLNFICYRNEHRLENLSSKIFYSKQQLCKTKTT